MVLEHFGFFWQSFAFQAFAPWPSKTPPPDNVKSLMYRNPIQVSGFVNWVLSSGACNVPWSCISIGALQGPENSASFNGYVPFGIIILLGDVDAHASFHAFVKA